MGDHSRHSGEGPLRLLAEAPGFLKRVKREADSDLGRGFAIAGVVAQL